MSKEKLTYKMIILGDSSVGKSSLFKKLITEKFDPKIISTIGIDRRTLPITINTPDEGEKEIDITLYDTAGQERYRTLSINYFRDSQGLLIVYDITQNDTFQNIESWLDNIKETLGENDDYLMILLGNKLDLINDNPSKRAVTVEDAKNFCQKNKLFWGGECSIKDIEIEDLKDLFKGFIEEVYSKIGNNIHNKHESSSILEKSKHKKRKKNKECC